MAELPGIRAAVDRLRETVGPDGIEPADKVTFPEKPLTLPSAMLDVTEPPWAKLKADGLATILKPESCA